MKKVSIIVPVYNGEKVLGRCVDSILKQDYPGIEVILVDDGSKDASFAAMEDYACRDERVRAIHKKNGGVSSTRNLGLAAASGDYIQFVDVDDWLPMDSTKLLVREMETNPVDLVIGDFYRVVEENVSQKGSIERGGVLSRRQYADEMMHSPADLYYGVLWNKLYKREIIEREAIRMDENISYSEDMIFNLEYLLHVENISVLKAPVYYYIHTKGSLVDQSMNLSSTVKMKSNVIGYYNDFYKNTFDTPEYQERLPTIYSYLLSVSTDSLTLPFAPGTKKLGTESGKRIFYSQALDRTPLQTAYLSTRLIDRYLDTLAKKHGLERHELQLLYFLKKLDAPCSVENIAAFTGLNRMMVVMVLAKLMAAGLVTRDRKPLTDDQKERYRYNAPEISEDLEQMERDYDAVCYDGLSEDELTIYRRCAERIIANIRSRMALGEPS